MDHYCMHEYYSQQQRYCCTNNRVLFITFHIVLRRTENSYTKEEKVEVSKTFLHFSNEKPERPS